MHRRDALLAMLSTAAFAGLGCSGAGNGKRRIAVVPKGTSHDFWKSVHYGADKAGTEAGVEVLWNGTSDEKDSTGQRQIVDTFVGRQVDGICLAPISKTTGGQIIQSAKRQDIPTVVFDSGVEERFEQDIVSYVATDNSKGGRMAGERLAEVMGGEGGVILLRYQVGSESTEQREKGFLDVITDKKKYPRIKLLSDSEHIDSSVEKAQKASESLLGRFGDEVKGVFTVCEPNNKGMYLALEQFIKNGKLKPGDVKFVGFDSDPRMIEGLKNGMVQGVVLQNPVNMGYLAVKTMVAHLNGKEVEKRISTGEEIALPEHLNKDHKDYAKFQALLKPKQL